MPDVSPNNSANPDGKAADTTSTTSVEDQFYTNPTSGAAPAAVDDAKKTEDEAAKNEPAKVGPTAEEKAATDKKIADDAKAAEDKKAADDKRIAEDKAALDAAKPPEMTAEEKAAYDKMTDAEKKAFDDKRLEDAKAAVQKTLDEKNKGQPLDLSDIDAKALAMPEGMELDKEILGELGAVAGELGLDKAGATKLVPLGIKLAEKVQHKTEAAYKTLRAGWVKEIEGDKDIGGADNLKITNRGLETYGTPELRKLLDDSGLGDHPAVHRHFHKLGLSASEDVIEKGGSGDKTKSDTSIEDSFYPTMTNKR